VCPSWVLGPWLLLATPRLAATRSIMSRTLLIAAIVHAAKTSSLSVLDHSPSSIIPEENWQMIANDACSTISQSPSDTIAFPNEGANYPRLYLLGTQKAGTTSVAQSLKECGLVSFGIPTPSTNISLQCAVEKGGGYYHECKETLHSPITLIDDAHRDAFRRMHDVANCRRDLDSNGADTVRTACRSGHFLSATPLGAPCADAEWCKLQSTPSIESFLTLMPANILSSSRFAIIFREPVASLLSFYNHVLQDDSGIINPSIDMSSFAAFFDALCPNCSGFKRAGAYRYREWAATHMDPWYASSAVSRSQLLVLSFDYVLNQTADAMRVLTQHYGLPRILTSMSKLPETNTHDGPAKVVKIRCSTRREAGAAYSDANTRLFDQLAADRVEGRAPHYEPAFPDFDLESSVKCSNHEVTMGELTPAELTGYLELRRTRAGAAGGGASDRTTDNRKVRELT